MGTVRPACVIALRSTGVLLAHEAGQLPSLHDATQTQAPPIFWLRIWPSFCVPESAPIPRQEFGNVEMGGFV